MIQSEIPIVSCANRPSMRWLFTFVLVALAAVAVPGFAQDKTEGPSQPQGYIEDWSSHHLIFSNPGTEDEARERGEHDKWLRIVNDPRYIMQQRIRHAPPRWRSGDDERSMKRDWSMNVFNPSNLTLSVSSTPGSGTVSGSSTLTIDGQTFTGSAPVAEIGTLTVSAAPSTSSSLQVGVVTYDFCTGTNCVPTTESANTCTVSEGTPASTTTTYNDLVGAIKTPATGGSRSTWECGTITGNTAGYTSNNTVSKTITITAVTAGSVGFTVTPPSSGITFSDTAAGDQAGSDGTDSATTFKYTTNSAYDTEAQLANDLYTAINDNTTVTGDLTVSYTSGDTSIAFLNTAATSDTVSDASFTALSGTGTMGPSTVTTALQPNTYPAKFNFGYSTSTPSCSDYVVYPTGLAGSATQATMIGYTNLYETTCTTGSVPTVYFAYNTGGTSSLSPVLSLDGTQVAYIQVSSSVASLVLLKPAAALTANKSGSCSISNTSTSITGCPSGFFTQATLGAPITGTNIAAGTYIASITSATQATLSAAATGTATESVTLAAPTAAAPYTLVAQSSASNYRTCTAPCFYTLQFNGSPNDSNSSPFYVYFGPQTDSIFVGDDNGKLHKFNPVFLNPPAEITANWPVTASTGANPMLTSPVYDSGASQLVFVGDATGYLNSVASGTNPGTVKTSPQMECGTYGFVDGPVVDSSAEYVYMFIGDGCSDGTTGNPVIYSSYVNVFAAGTALSGTSYGHNNAQFNNQSTNDLKTVQYHGIFDNTYYSGSGNTGNLYACVNGVLYQFEMAKLSTTTQVTHTTSPGYSVYDTPASAVSDAATCSALTEYYNTGTSTDYLFFSLQANGSTVGTTSCTNGCILNYDITSAGTTGNPSDALQAAGGTGGIIIDNSGSGTGESQVYFGSLSNESCAGNGTTGSGTGSCAVQASQSALQ